MSRIEHYLFINKIGHKIISTILAIIDDNCHIC